MSDLPSLLTNFSTNRTHVNQIIDYCARTLASQSNAQQSIDRTNQYLEDCLCSIGELIGQVSCALTDLIDEAAQDLQHCQLKTQQLTHRCDITQHKAAQYYVQHSFAAHVNTTIARQKAQITVLDAELPAQNRIQASQSPFNPLQDADSLSTLGMEQRRNRFTQTALRTNTNSEPAAPNLAVSDTAGFATPPLMGTVRQSFNVATIQQAISAIQPTNNASNNATNHSNRSSLSAIPTPPSIDQSAPPAPPLDVVQPPVNHAPDEATHLRRISVPPPLPSVQSTTDSISSDATHVRRVSVPPPLPRTSLGNQSTSQSTNDGTSTPPTPPRVSVSTPPPINQTINQSSEASKLSGVAALRNKFGTLTPSTTQSSNAPGSVGRTSFTINPSRHSTSQSISPSSEPTINQPAGRKSIGPPPVPVAGRTSIGPPPVPRTSLGNQSTSQSANDVPTPPAVPSLNQPSRQSMTPPVPPMMNHSTPPIISQSTNDVPMPPPITQSAVAPPPPGPPGPPGPPAMTQSVKTPVKISTGGSGDRSAILNGIQNFKGGLRKVQTVDKSAPIIEGKSTTSSASSSSGAPSSSSSAMPGRSSMNMQDEMAARLARMRAKNG